MIDTIQEIWNQLSFIDILLIIGAPVWIFIIITNYLKSRAIHKNQLERLKQLEEKKCDGPHKWLYMNIAGASVNVCELCCWSPTHEGYIKKLFVDAEKESNLFDLKLEQYVKDRLKELGISKELYDKAINIKKDFALKYLDKKMKEMAGE